MSIFYSIIIIIIIILFINNCLLSYTYTYTISDVFLDILFKQGIHDTSVPLLQLVAIMVPVVFFTTTEQIKFIYCYNYWYFIRIPVKLVDILCLWYNSEDKIMSPHPSNIMNANNQRYNQMSQVVWTH